MDKKEQIKKYFEMNKDKHFTLPYCKNYFGNLLTLSLDLCEWDLAQYIIENSNTNILIYRVFPKFQQLTPIDYLDNLRSSIPDNDKIKLDETLKLLEEKQLSLKRQKH